jgi:hypothetical protein
MYKVYTAQFQEGAELGLAIRGLMRQLGLTLKENRKIIHSNWHSLGVEGLKVISLWEGGTSRKALYAEPSRAGTVEESVM